MKLTKKILIGSLAAFAIAMLTGCPGNNGPTSKPTPGPGPSPEPNTELDKLGTVGPNLVDNGDADETEGEIMDMSTYNLTKEAVPGGVTGNAWKITQTGSWGEVIVDITKCYAPGKSFRVSAKVKNDPDADSDHKDCQFTASYCVYSGAVKNWAIEQTNKTGEDVAHYDYDGSDENIVGPWDGKKDTSGEAYGYSADDFNLVTELSDDWEEINYIIPASEIEAKINNSGLYVMEVEFYAGPEANAGYSYLIDDISIVDLNTEIKRAGRTWEDPNAPDPNDDPDDNGDDEEDEEE